MDFTDLYRRIRGTCARDSYQELQQTASSQLQLLQHPGDARHRAAALDAAGRALVGCGDLAEYAHPRQARRSGLGHRYGYWSYEEARACRVLASVEWARLALEEDPDHIHPIHPRDPLEGHPDVEPVFLRLCHEPDLEMRALTIRRRLAPALHRHLPEAEMVLTIIAESYLQAATNTTAAIAVADAGLRGSALDRPAGQEPAGIPAGAQA